MIEAILQMHVLADASGRWRCCDGKRHLKDSLKEKTPKLPFPSSLCLRIVLRGTEELSGGTGRRAESSASYSLCHKARECLLECLHNSVISAIRVALSSFV